MRTEYTYAAAYVKSLEANMLTDGDFEMLLDYDWDEIIRFLRGKGYEGEGLEEMLENERRKVWELCIGLCGDEPLLGAALAENDFYNIKSVIKSVISGVSWSELIYEPTRIDCAELEKAIKSADFSGLDDKFAVICKRAYEICAKKTDGRAIELYLDKQQLLMQLTESAESEFVHGWAEQLALKADLNIYLRSEGASAELLKEALTENSLIDVNALARGAESREETLAAEGYGEDFRIFQHSASEFEKLCDNRVTEYLKKASMSFFEFDAVLAYLEAKKTEIKNIRIAAYGRRCGMPRKELAERMRKAYV